MKFLLTYITCCSDYALLRARNLTNVQHFKCYSLASMSFLKKFMRILLLMKLTPIDCCRLCSNFFMYFSINRPICVY
jgi:hypothetical protein